MRARRAQIADGELSATAIITSEMASLIVSEAVVQYQLVTLKEYLINTVSGKQMAIILQMEPLSPLPI